MEKLNIPQCPHCQAILVEKQGKKGSFYTCPNWKSDKSGCEGTIWFPARKKNFDRTEKAKGEFDQGEQIVKKLNQLLFLMTGLNPETHKDDFEEMMKNELGKGLLRRTTIEKIIIPTGK